MARTCCSTSCRRSDGAGAGSGACRERPIVGKRIVVGVRAGGSEDGDLGAPDRDLIQAGSRDRDVIRPRVCSASARTAAAATSGDQRRRPYARPQRPHCAPRRRRTVHLCGPEIPADRKHKSPLLRVSVLAARDRQTRRKGESCPANMRARWCASGVTVAALNGGRQDKEDESHLALPHRVCRATCEVGIRS